MSPFSLKLLFVSVFFTVYVSQQQEEIKYYLKKNVIACALSTGTEMCVSE